MQRCPYRAIHFNMAYSSKKTRNHQNVHHARVKRCVLNPSIIHSSAQCPAYLAKEQCGGQASLKSKDLAVQATSQAEPA